MRVDALEFLNVADGLPYAPTRAWVIQDPDGGRGLGDWVLTLDEPDEGVPAYPVHHVKHWLLFGDNDDLYWTVSQSRGFTDARRLNRREVAEMYLRGLASEIHGVEERPLSVLIPSLGEQHDEARQRYLEVIEAAFPDQKVRVLSEPEMVVEYFRLVRRSLELDPERNNVILVVDLGASTTDISVVFSNRGGRVVGGDTTRRRTGRLQAIQGVTSEVAGQWVDKRLAEDLGIEVPEEPARASLILADIERAKVRASRGEYATLRSTELTTEMMSELAWTVADALTDALNQIRTQVWSRVTSSDYAAEKWSEVLQSREITDSSDALRLVDHVLLAGGTSRLPGFRDALSVLFDDRVRFHEVGDAFPVAAAVGAMAHVLRSKYRPPRLRTTGEEPDPDLQVEDLEGGLEMEISLEWHPRGERARHLRVLDRGDPLAYAGGVKEAVGTLDLERGDRSRARFIPDTESSGRRGLQPQRVTARSDQPSVGIQVDPHRKVHLLSKELSGAEAIFLDLNHFDQRQVAAPSVHQGAVPGSSIAFDFAEDVVIDFGMSKSVIVQSHVGLLDPRSLDRACAGSAATRVAPSTDPPPTTATSAIAASSASLTPAPPEPPSKPRHPTPGSETSTPVLAKVPKVADALPASPAQGDQPGDTAPEESDAHLLGESPSEHDEPSDEEDASTPDDASSEAEPDPEAPPGGSGDVFGQSVPEPDPEQRAPFSWSNRMEPDDFGHALRDLLQGAEEEVVHGTVLALMALSVREFVLLAGPPGCGKSTLARSISGLLGLSTGGAGQFVEIPVQAHWRDDSHVLGAEALLPADRDVLVLFDEFNLTRPEYYLSRLFHQTAATRAPESRWRAFGTLNIDDTSRPPSPKIVDRCLLLELDQVRWRTTPQHQLGERSGLPGLARIELPETLPSDERVDTLVEAIETSVEQNHLRQDLLPSWRVREDIQAMLGLWEAAALHALLPRDVLVDRLIASRILVKISGAYEQVKPLLASISPLIDQWPALKQTQRRMGIMQKQRVMGFVSPWQ